VKATLTRQRRSDPNRRERILEAALEAIAEYGVHGFTHRKIASMADVPLGSMTYHFNGMQDLLTQAFNQFSAQISAHFAHLMSGAENAQQAKAAVVDIICGEGWASQRNMLLSCELYAYASRDPAIRPVLQNWLEHTRSLLQKHFDRRTADALDALVEGYTIHRSVDQHPATRQDIAAIVDRVVTISQ